MYFPRAEVGEKIGRGEPYARRAGRPVVPLGIRPPEGAVGQSVSSGAP
jgi:hypothetical protein